MLSLNQFPKLSFEFHESDHPKNFNIIGINFIDFPFESSNDVDIKLAPYHCFQHSSVNRAKT